MTENDEMDRLAELGAELYPAEPPSARMRTRVLAGTTPAAARPNRMRPLLVAGGVTAVAVAAVLAVGLRPGTDGHSPGTGATAVRPVAFTLRVNGDGSVTFTARDLVDAGAATRALNQAGIAGRVANITGGACAGGPLDTADVDNTVRGQKAVVGWGGDNDTVTVRSADYPPGGGLLLAVSTLARKTDGRVGTGVLVLPFKDADQIPACVQLPGPRPS